MRCPQYQNISLDHNLCHISKGFPFLWATYVVKVQLAQCLNFIELFFDAAHYQTWIGGLVQWTTLY